VWRKSSPEGLPEGLQRFDAGVWVGVPFRHHIPKQSLPDPNHSYDLAGRGNCLTLRRSWRLGVMTVHFHLRFKQQQIHFSSPVTIWDMKYNTWPRRTIGFFEIFRLYLLCKDSWMTEIKTYTSTCRTVSRGFLSLHLTVPNITVPLHLANPHSLTLDYVINKYNPYSRNIYLRSTLTSPSHLSLPCVHSPISFSPKL
jgi:hypothetical protein